jgi:predicted transcriptional regulator
MAKSTTTTVRILAEKQIARIKASLDDAKSGSPGVPHAEVERWVKSWDLENELPRPGPPGHARR